jgi:hypothetical protein
MNLATPKVSVSVKRELLCNSLASEVALLNKSDLCNTTKCNQIHGNDYYELGHT